MLFAHRSGKDTEKESELQLIGSIEDADNLAIDAKLKSISDSANKASNLTTMVKVSKYTLTAAVGIAGIPSVINFVDAHFPQVSGFITTHTQDSFPKIVSFLQNSTVSETLSIADATATAVLLGVSAYGVMVHLKRRKILKSAAREAEDVLKIVEREGVAAVKEAEKIGKALERDIEKDEVAAMKRIAEVRVLLRKRDADTLLHFTTIVGELRDEIKGRSIERPSRDKIKER